MFYKPIVYKITDVLKYNLIIYILFSLFLLTLKIIYWTLMRKIRVTGLGLFKFTNTLKDLGTCNIN
jgi:hypothetical protein